MIPGDSYRCEPCGILFPRTDDATEHRIKNHYKPSPGIREAIDRLRDEDREILDKLADEPKRWFSRAELEKLKDD